ncbi:hypothetical protein RZO07_04280 [Pseudomonas protegens]|uniref:hypothetical protein n=1 Tax=Pseudomonas protegens TaxID=380021 RepID=UPI002936EFE2|nr:hypothetical protein [Pseudomonas protegens]WOE80445.1 hypothetical protein RZO07_04280 [Pseudomonas protegens]
MKKWKLALIGAVSLFLAACEKAPTYEFKGQYFAMEGEECTTPANVKEGEQYYLEITKEVRGRSVLFSANFPAASKAGLPVVSAQSVSPNDDNQLTFNFYEPKSAGTPTEATKFNIVLSVIPNQSKEGHLWATKAEMNIARDGRVQQYDILENLRRFFELGKAGVCLRKGTATG